MKIDAQTSRYLGDKGWESDPQLFAQVAVTWSQWIGQAGEHLYAAQILLTHVQQRDAEIHRLMESRHSGTVLMSPSLTGIYFLHCAFSVENAFKGVIAAERAVEIEREIRKTEVEFLRTLWHIMSAFVELGFGVDSVIPMLAQKASENSEDALQGNIPTHEFNLAVDDQPKNEG